MPSAPDAMTRVPEERTLQHRVMHPIAPDATWMRQTSTRPMQAAPTAMGPMPTKVGQMAVHSRIERVSTSKAMFRAKNTELLAQFAISLLPEIHDMAGQTA
jgi:hypothetical protein